SRQHHILRSVDQALYSIYIHLAFLYTFICIAKAQRRGSIDRKIGRQHGKRKTCDIFIGLRNKPRGGRKILTIERLSGNLGGVIFAVLSGDGGPLRQGPGLEWG